MTAVSCVVGKLQSRQSLRAVALTLPLAFGGCTGSMPTFEFTAPRQQMIAELGEPGGQGRVTLREDPARVPRSTVNLGAPHSVVVHAKTEKYLEDLLQELVAQVPEGLAADKEIDVFLTSHDGSAHLFATGADDILVGYRALTSLKSRDELAFAMAHELSHILLGHNEGQEAIFSLDTAIKLVDKMTVLAASYRVAYSDGTSGAQQLTPEQQRELAESVSEIRIAANALRSSVTGVLHGAWSRSQERDADRLGYDLLIAAGYNGEGAGRLLDRFGEEPSLRADVARHVDEMEKAAQALVEITDQGSFGLLFKKLGIAGAAQGVKATLALLDDTHEEAAERKQELYEAYVDALDLDRNLDRLIDERRYEADLRGTGFLVLKDTLDRARDGYIQVLNEEVPASPVSIVSGAGSRIGFNRYALYAIREYSGNEQSALANLRIAWGNRPQDYATSSEYAVRLAARGDLGQAMEIVERLEDTYPGDAPLYDLRGRVLEGAGDPVQARQQWDACDGSGRSYMRKRCEYEIYRLDAASEQVALQQDHGASQLMPSDAGTQQADDTGANPFATGLEQLKGLFTSPAQ